MRQASPAPAPGDATVIREADTADLALLEELERASFASDRLKRRSLSALIRSPSAHVLVAGREGTIIGSVVVLTRRGSRVARLYSLSVDRRLSGQGIGSRLLAAAEEAAAARAGAERLRLEVRTDNAAAISLYERRGYVRIGRRDDYYEDGASALRYEREIPRASQSAPSCPSTIRAALPPDNPGRMRPRP
jgi:ribosomal protein S18 acetylase RimI-like enzyme